MSTSSKLDHALKLARQGHLVFPLVSEGKTPAFSDWQALATRDERTIQRWWGVGDLGPEFDPDYNIGVATGDVVVLDVDSYKGADATALGLPETMVVRTARGGEHRYFAAPEGIWIGNTAGRLAHGIDTRGHGGYVVGPGSTIDGQRYEITREAPLAPLPIDLEMELAQPAPPVRSSVPLAPACELDTPETIDFARRWLAEFAPEAVEGRGGREATKRVAQALGDFGLSPGAAFDLLTEPDGWDAQKAAPSWVGSGQDEDLRRLIEDMLTCHRNEPLGCAHAAVFGASDVFESVEIVIPRRKAFQLLSAREALQSLRSVSARPLVKGLLDQGACSVLYGPSNSGKTFVALDVAFSVATGSPWNGCKAERSAVLYVAAEGGRGVRKRAAAWLNERGATEDPPLFILEHPANLRDPKDCAALVQCAKDAAERSGLPVGLIVLDTLSRVLAGGDENSSVDMGALVRSIDRLRELTGAHVLIIHHTGKDVARGARGHSLLRAAVDTELEIDQKRLTVTKQRDLEALDPLRFELQTIGVGEDAEGEPMSSCVVNWRTSAEDDFAVGLTGMEKLVLELARSLSGQGEVHSADIEDASSKRTGTPLSRSRISELRKALITKGFLVDAGRGRWILAPSSASSG